MHIVAGAAPSPLTGAAPTLIPSLGFSSALVIDATADAVRDFVGWKRESQPWRFHGVAEWMRFGVMRHRVQSLYTVELTSGTIALAAKRSEYDQDHIPWTFVPHIQGLLFPDEPLNRQELDDAKDYPSRVIEYWSRRSRARMVRAIAEINHDTWSGTGDLGMVTLTLPGRWLDVAPSGSDFKGMLRRLRWRWERQIGPWQAVWKLEFQRRGAPHFHILMQVPALVNGRRFEDWLSQTWADIVAADNTYCTKCAFAADLCDCPRGFEATEYARHLSAGTNVDMGLNLTDPKRVAVYFLKHSSKTQDSKEYQHIVPRAWRKPGLGPGRFWGIAGVKRHRATVELDRQTWIELRRILRGVHRGARARTALARRSRVVGQMGESRRKSTLTNLHAFGTGRDRILASSSGGGWILANDAPALLHLVTHWLSARDSGGM